MYRQDTWDYRKEITLEDLKLASSQISMERRESGWGKGYYDYTPDPTLEEAWQRAYYDKNPYPDRG